MSQRSGFLHPLFARQLAAELIGTFAIVFAGCGSVMVSERFPGSVAPGIIPGVFGLAVCVMIYSVGHISGAHFNPAVTLAFTLSRHLPGKSLFGYWLAQLLGALAAMGVLVAILPGGHSFGETVSHVPVLAALAWETLLTFFLMFVIIAVATDTRAVGTMAGAAIGGTVALAAAVGGPVTGASMNPARTLAPALFAGQGAELWIYLVGPCLGAVAAALTYTWIRGESVGNESAGKSAPSSGPT